MCSSCVESRGLCRACATGDRSLLPQLADNVRWKEMIHRGKHYHDKGMKPSPEAQRLQARRERRRARRMEELKFVCGELLSTAAA